MSDKEAYKKLLIKAEREVITELNTSKQTDRENLMKA
jgi:hypothetical protein